MPYIGKSNEGFGIRERFLYLASAGDTTVSGTDSRGISLTFSDPEYVDVYLNGVRLKLNTDYNLNTSNTVAGLTALSANDEVEVMYLLLVILVLVKMQLFLTLVQTQM
jgi:hypothetical protein